MKRDARTTAENYIQAFYPDAFCAILSGSVVRGEATSRSDLDLFICGDDEEAPYRKSLTFQGWPIELFIHDKETYRHFLAMDALEGRATLPRMISEGVVIKDTGIAKRIVRDANEVMARGPVPWTEKEADIKRYFLTDMLDDFEGCEKREEGIFIAGQLAESAHEYLLRMNGCWIGRSKWIPRAIMRYDSVAAVQLIEALDAYYLKRNKDLLIQYVDRLLDQYGGRLFDGFYLK